MAGRAAATVKQAAATDETRPTPSRIDRAFSRVSRLSGIALGRRLLGTMIDLAQGRGSKAWVTQFGVIALDLLSSGCVLRPIHVTGGAMEPTLKESGRPSQSSWGLVAYAFAVGAVSLLGNMVWNCSTCGWDLDGVPWYQALLVAGVPFILAPVVAVAFAVRALALRTRRATTEFLLASLGLALPWAYFLVAS
jgi:hypothetical protein